MSKRIGLNAIKKNISFLTTQHFREVLDALGFEPSEIVDVCITCAIAISEDGDLKRNLEDQIKRYKSIYLKIKGN